MPRVLIAGAGARGLVCARALADAGCDVELIEAAQRVGGSLLEAEAFSVEPSTAASLGARAAAPLALEAWPQVPPPTVAAPSPDEGHGRWRRLAARWLPQAARSRPAALTPAAPDPARVLLSGPDLARDLGGRLSVRFGWNVLEVAPYGRGASLLYQAPSGEKRLEADAAVVAVPASAASRIVPGLDEAARHSLAEAPRRRSLWVIWDGLAPPSSDRAWRIDDPALADLSQLWQTGERVAVCFTPDAAARLADAPESEITSLAEAGLAARAIATEGVTPQVVRAAWDAAPGEVEPPSREVALALATADDAGGALAGGLRAARQILAAVGKAEAAPEAS